MPKAAVAAAALLLLAALAGSFLLSSRQDPTLGCEPQQAAARLPDEVAGYRGEQLQNAAAIIAAGATAGIDLHGQTLAVMVAAGESGLRSLDHGDAAGPDSRGLFQQRANWGSLATRLDPTGSARLFYARLTTIRGWQQLAPTAAAHAVQGNADPGYYTRYWAPAEAIVAALTDHASQVSDTTCTDTRSAVATDAHTLATNLTAAIDDGRITGLVPDHLREIRWIAEGRTVPDCGVDTRILQIITVALDTFHRLGISDINRRCTGQLLGAGIESSHWINGGGHAVDFYALAGHPITGADADSLTLIRRLDPVLPAGARIGQQQCRQHAGTDIALTHLTEFDDTCNHLHIDVAYTSKPLLIPAEAALPAAQLSRGEAAAASFDHASGLRAAARSTGPGQLLLSAGTWSLTDFQDDLHGADLPAPGLQGAGSSRTVIAMTPGSSSRTGDIPTRPFTTNQLDLLAITGGSPQLGGFTLQATDQHHLYNGLRVAHATGLRASDITVTGVPGAANYPPGETFAINDWRTTGSIWTGITIDGAGVGAAGFGANSSRDLTIRDSQVTGTRYSAGLALWQTDDIHLDHIAVVGNAAGINVERSGGAITITDSTFADNGKYDLQFMTDRGDADVAIINPVLAPGQRLRIHLPARYHGTPNRQQRASIHVYRDGIDQTAALIDWT